MQLFCAPHAGSSALNYYQWKQDLSNTITVVPLELAGRGLKSKIEPFTELTAAVEDVWSDFLKEYDGNEYALFGHSLGCWIIYELYNKIDEAGMRLPKALFLSGNCPPFYRKPKDYSNMTEEGFVEAIMELGGTNESVFEDKEVREKYLNLMRADFIMAETSHCPKREQSIQSHVVVLGGTEDKSVTTKDLLSWKEVVAGSYTLCRIKGDHFFPFTNEKDTLKVIEEILLQ